MESIRIKDLAKAAQARLFGIASLSVSSIVIDSRETAPASMFVCIVGENNDGHKYVEPAYENGCRVFLMSDVEVVSSFMQKHDDIGVILTNDTEEAFRLMAEWYLNSLTVKKIGVTGSVGKTTTKSLVHAVLSEKYRTVCNDKNYNTKLGLCMTTFKANRDTQIIVYEMGMDRSGEIDEYCSWIKPDTAIITVIGDSHLERLGSKEAIADAKLEITHRLRQSDALIYNSDSPFLDMYTLSKMTKMNFTPIPVGQRDAVVHIEKIADHGLKGISFVMKTKDEKLNIALPLLGKHNAINAALAATCGMAYEVPTEKIIKALANASGTDRRLAYEDINGLTLLDDSYNANPASMAAGLEVLASVNAKRHVAILADMYELGEDEESGHIQTGEKAGEVGVDLLIAIGRNASLMADGALSKSRRISVVKFKDVESAAEKIMSLLAAGDAVLVKGSNATRVSAVAEMIRSMKA